MAPASSAPGPRGDERVVAALDDVRELEVGLVDPPARGVGPPAEDRDGAPVAHPLHEVGAERPHAAGRAALVPALPPLDQRRRLAGAPLERVDAGHVPGCVVEPVTGPRHVGAPVELTAVDEARRERAGNRRRREPGAGRRRYAGERLAGNLRVLEDEMRGAPRLVPAGDRSPSRRLPDREAHPAAAAQRRRHVGAHPPAVRPEQGDGPPAEARRACEVDRRLAPARGDARHAKAAAATAEIPEAQRRAGDAAQVGEGEADVRAPDARRSDEQPLRRSEVLVAVRARHVRVGGRPDPLGTRLRHGRRGHEKRQH